MAGGRGVEVVFNGDWEGFDEALMSVLETPDAVFGVGVPDEQHPGPRASAHPIAIRDIARINEYGSDSIPARPIFGPAMDKHESEYLEEIQDALSEAVRGGDWKGMLEGVTERMVDDVQNEIDNYGHQPPLAERTIQRKGHDQPWVETEALRQSIQGAVQIDASSFSSEAKRFRDSKGRFKRVRAGGGE